MIDADDERLSLVRDLLEMKEPLAETLDKLSQYPWDFEKRGVVLTAGHLEKVLDRDVKNELSAEQVDMWANSVEGRDDIEIGGDEHSDFHEVLNELANPTLTHLLTLERAKVILQMLSSRAHSPEG